MAIRLLIVDDYNDNLMLLAQIAEILDCEYVFANNGKEALDALSKESFDIVLMDIEMPVMNGLEATEEIRALPYPKGNVPVVAITAHHPDLFMDKYGSLGFNGYISKPYTMDKVQVVLDKFCKR